MSNPREAPPGPAAVSFGDAFAFWLRLGFISFGGPAGQIAIMHQELVERRRWISEQRFLHALNYTMVLPGPEAQQLATYIGWLLHGTAGGLVAGALFVLPSFFIIAALAWIYLEHHDLPVVAGIFYGIKPAVTAVVLHAAIRIGGRALRSHALRAVAVLAFVAIFAFDLPFPWIVLGAGLMGLCGAHLLPDQFRAGPEHGGVSGPHAAALIDDDTPLPDHARFRWSRLIANVAAGLILWLTAMGALVATFSWQGTLTQMGWFFTKAALLTFGGAYAVLPYVYQGAVEHYGWIAGTQMIDGLALGETTPGPLIMIVAFVGFVGGWAGELFGAERLVLAGAAGAAVATFFTFLPSFLFILAGAPAVEATRHEIRLSAPLSGITAAVVGVIVNLALFFAWHVFWPRGWDGGFDVFSAVIGIAAFIALVRLRAGIVPVIAACAAAGLLHTLLA
ncbi:MAG TPA: chromate efflux transporter [Gammaproteobacteria bacterium]